MYKEVSKPKTFLKEISIWLLALPAGAQVFSMMPATWRGSELFTRVVLSRNEASLNFWSKLLGAERAIRQPYDHSFFTFSVLIYLPAVIYLFWVFGRRQWAGVPLPNLEGQNDLKWYLLAGVGAYVVFYTFIPDMGIIFLPLGVAIQLVISLYLLNAAVTANGMRRFRKKVAFPLFKNERFDRPFLGLFAFSMGFAAMGDLREMTPVADLAKWLASGVNVPLFFIVFVAMRFGHRWPAKVFLAGGSIVFVDWALKVAIPSIELLLFTPAST